MHPLPTLPPPSSRPWAAMEKGGGWSCPEGPLEAKGTGEELYLAREGSKSLPAVGMLGDRDRQRQPRNRETCRGRDKARLRTRKSRERKGKDKLSPPGNSLPPRTEQKLRRSGLSPVSTGVGVRRGFPAGPAGLRPGGGDLQSPLWGMFQKVLGPQEAGRYGPRWQESPLEGAEESEGRASV